MDSSTIITDWAEILSSSLLPTLARAHVFEIKDTFSKIFYFLIFEQGSQKRYIDPDFSLKRAELRHFELFWPPIVVH